MLGVLYVTWRIRPTAHNALACGLLTVLLLGPVSWAGYTLFLLPFLFARKWDRVTWAAVVLLAAPFSPQDSVTSMGRTSSTWGLSIPPVRAMYDWTYGASGWVSSAGTDMGTTIADPMGWLWNAPWQLATHAATFLQPLTDALMGSVYVWAVLLLLMRFMWEQTREQPAPIPYRSNTPGSLRRLR
jgi:hypothetical protein